MACHLAGLDAEDDARKSRRLDAGCLNCRELVEDDSANAREGVFGFRRGRRRDLARRRRRTDPLVGAVRATDSTRERERADQTDVRANPDNERGQLRRLRPCSESADRVAVLDCVHTDAHDTGQRNRQGRGGRSFPSRGSTPRPKEEAGRGRA